MSDDEPAGQLGDAPEAGVHRIERTELEALYDAGRGAGLHCARLDLEACRSKADLLAALAQELRFPAWFGHNWDALADSLDDLEWLQASGYLLVLENPETLSNAAPEDFGITLDILAEAARKWRARGTPFRVFLVAKETK
jgi:RNAse (barnase) inhibitor barstar